MPTSLSNSTVLDAFGANMYSAADYASLFGTPAQVQATLQKLFTFDGYVPSVASYSPSITVGLVLERNNNNDPMALLNGTWAQRQTALADQAAVWSTYGANTTEYNDTMAALTAIVGSSPMLIAAGNGYVSSAPNRTIWMELSAGQFNDLFGTPLSWLEGKVNNSKTAPESQLVPTWAGNLSLPDSIPAGVIGGVWFEAEAIVTNPVIADRTAVTLSAGPLGIGNASTAEVSATPAAIAANYNFPLPAGVATPAIALVEGNVPASQQAGLLADLNAYRQAVGLPPITAEQFQIVTTNNDPTTISGELTLDISVIAGAAPNSTQLLYGYVGGSPYLSYQRAFFDTVNKPTVLSSSYALAGNPTANSPFQWAFQQLFIDGALANVSVHVAAGDQGATGFYANGVPNITNSQTSPFGLMVGGTSIANLSGAQADSTMAAMLKLALNDDPATVFALVASGLKTLPSNLSASAPTPADAATTLTTLFETVWQSLSLQPNPGAGPPLTSPFGANETGTGGVANGLAVPGYQSGIGVTPTSVFGTGRGIPDVSALSAGDSLYAVLNENYVNDVPGSGLIHPDGGTSAAAPLWAALTAQFNTIFFDQGLPQLGYYNDLLYIASVIAPGSFNDIQLGNNNNTFFVSPTATGYGNSNLDTYMVPTGQGFSAMAGYDLASGLGTPNGLLLARALTAIAHEQVSFSTSPAMLDQNDQGAWISGAAQNLLFQAVSPGGDSTFALDLGGQGATLFSSANASWAWTARLAQQSLQVDFDPGLALLFDKQSQGSVMQRAVAVGESVGVNIDGANGQALQGALSSSFGFTDFFSGSNPFAGGDALHVARAVAVAETVGGLDDQMAVVRLRQVGENSLSLQAYKVDDLAGTIDGVRPGDAGYVAAAASRLYQTIDGGSAIAGPGYGGYSQTAIVNVDAGDMIAFKLTNLTSGAHYWAFAHANETVNGQGVGHIWNYGLNTWGFEDTFGGGDRDYNDLVVQLDFTSAYGNGWLT